MGTVATTRAIHRANRHLPMRLVCWALLRALPRHHGLTDDLTGVVPVPEYPVRTILVPRYPAAMRRAPQSETA